MLKTIFTVVMIILLIYLFYFELKEEVIGKEKEKLIEPEKNLSKEKVLKEKLKSEKLCIKLNSSYNYVKVLPNGSFEIGQEADIVLNWFGFDDSGGPLTFNHPMGLSSDGKYLALADTRNNRILIWDHLPKGNELPFLVLGQKNFSTCHPGSGRDNLRWPVDVSIANGKIVVADTFNNRLLIWNEIPEENGTEADIVINAFGDGMQMFSWGVWTDGEKLLAVNTWHGLPCVYIWNEFPTSDDENPDLILQNKDFGTPRNIITDGKSYLIIGDHNPNVLEESTVSGGLFIWHSFPTNEKQPYDAFVEGLTWNVAVIGDDLYGVTITGIPVVIKNFRNLSGIVRVGSVERPDYEQEDNIVIFRNVMLGGGDGSKTVYLGNVTYLSLYNENRIVGYFGEPEDREPDFEIGNKLPSYFVDNPVPISYNGSLIILSGFSHKILVYERIPNESGAPPDIIYNLPFEPISGEFWNGKFYVIGRRGFMVWDVNSMKNCEEPEIFLREEDKVGGVSIEEGSDIAFDDRYAYLVSNGHLYVYEQPFNINSKPLKEIEIEGCQVRRVDSNGKKLAIGCFNDVYLLDVDTISLDEPRYIHIGGIPGGCDVFITKDKLFISDTGYNRVLIFNEIPESSEEVPDVIIGKKEFVQGLRPEDSVPEYTKTGLFWPEGIWYDGHFLWVGELKFSGRVLRYSPK